MGGIRYIPPAAAPVTIGNNLLRLPTGEVIDATLRPMEDGLGTDSGMQISTAFIVLLARFFGVGIAAPGYLAEFSGNDNTGSSTLTTVTVSNINTGSGSFAGFRIKVGSGLNGGNIIGSKNTLLAYGHANGMTFKTGVSGQDLGFTVSAASFAGTAAFVDWLMRNDGVMFFYNQNTPASANYGKVSIGNAPWDGATAGFFVGSVNGVSLAINERAGFVGQFANWQIAGVSYFRAFASGGNSYIDVVADINIRALSGLIFLTSNSSSIIIGAAIDINGPAFFTSYAEFSGNIKFAATGKGLQYLLSGAGPRLGTATLIGGTITILSNIVAAATSFIFIQRKTAGGVIGNLTYGNFVDGVSFDIISDNVLDTSVVIFNIIDGV